MIAPAPDAPTLGPAQHPGALVLYDGLCGFCDVSVQWLLRHDVRGALRFAPLHGPTAQAVLARHTEFPPDLDSIVFVEVLVEADAEVELLSWHSLAIGRICRRLPYPWRAAALLTLLPRPLRDAAYRAFAAVRYRVWGRRESCRIPTPAERARFLP